MKADEYLNLRLSLHYMAIYELLSSERLERLHSKIEEMFHDE